MTPPARLSAPTSSQPVLRGYAGLLPGFPSHVEIISTDKFGWKDPAAFWIDCRCYYDESKEYVISFTILDFVLETISLAWFAQRWEGGGLKDANLSEHCGKNKAIQKRLLQVLGNSEHEHRWVFGEVSLTT